MGRPLIIEAGATLQIGLFLVGADSQYYSSWKARITPFYELPPQYTGRTREIKCVL